MQIRFASAKSVFDQLALLGYSETSRRHGYGAVIDWVRDRSACFRGRRQVVLDIGCADGQMGAELQRAGVSGHLTGVDFSDAMLEKCRETGLYGELVRCDLNFGLALDRGPRFSLVIACGVLDFVEDAARVLRDLRDLVQPGAHLLLTFESPPARADPELLQPWKFPRDALDVLPMLGEAGYRIESSGRCVAYQAVTDFGGGGLRSLGVDVEYCLLHARWDG